MVIALKEKARIPKDDMDSFNATYNSVATTPAVDTSSLTTAIKNVDSAIDELSKGKFTEPIDSVINKMKNQNTSEFDKKFGSFKAELDNLDISQADDLVTQLEDAFSSIDNQKQQLDVVAMVLNTTDTLFSTRVPALIQSFNASTLKEVKSNSGVSGMLEYLLQAIDKETRWLEIRVNGSASDILNISATNLTAEMKEQLELVKFAVDEDFASEGSIYFLAKLAMAMAMNHESKGLVDPNSPDSNTLTETKNGTAYANGTICVTKTCLENTIEQYDQRTVQELFEVPVPMPLRMFLTAFTLIPALIGLVALVAILLSVCCRQKCGKASSCLSTCTCVSSCMCAPWIFLIVGLLFAVLLMVGDVCYGVENVGHAVLVEGGDFVCQNTLGGTGAVHDSMRHQFFFFLFSLICIMT